jgi:hypothetical protein
MVGLFPGNKKLLFLRCIYINMQRSICWNLSSLVSPLLLVLVSYCFCWVSYLAYPNLLGKKALILLLMQLGYIEQRQKNIHKNI